MTEKMTYEQLEEHVERLERRLKHLLQSKTVQLFDEVDPRTGDYKRNIKRLDTYGVHYKVREYEQTGRVPGRGARVIQVHAKEITAAAKSLERLTKAIKEAKTAWTSLFEDGECFFEITPEELNVEEDDAPGCHNCKHNGKPSFRGICACCEDQNDFPSNWEARK